MKSTLLCAAALAALATPAAARDRSAYFALEIGGMWVNDADVELDADPTSEFTIEHALGVDGDLLLGYDFGMFRGEIELAHKWAKHDRYDFASGSVEADGHSRVWSAMVNGLLDFGPDDGFNFYVGGGAGLASVRQTLDSPAEDNDLEDNGFAWQAIAGVRYPAWTHMDIGLKYRYFDGGEPNDDVVGGGRAESEFRSHSILGSLFYNFNAPERVIVAPPPPALPPPPPPAPATQTCPDGTVVLATDPCPMPPPPPPPPPPAPERG